MKIEKILIGVGITLLIVASVLLAIDNQLESTNEAHITKLVQEHARAWETGDDALLDSLLHADVVFAYPGRRLNKEQTLEDLRFFRDNYTDTKVYINRVIVNGDNVAVEWQFATTKKETGKREVVSDAVIGHMRDGQFDVWKEYLDGRVKGMQSEGALELEEGKEPFPWPMKTSVKE